MKKTAKKRKIRRRLIKIAVLLIVTPAVFIGMFIMAVKAGWFGKLPSGDELHRIQNETATLVYSADNVLLGKYFDENRTTIKWEALPEHLVNALVATEDSRFFSHEGIDSRSYLRVFFKTILLGDESSGGGSTITQQLAKNLFGRKDYAILTLPVNKVKEAVVARRLEAFYTKREILLLYLNTVPFGENVYGIEAAANRYFNKSTSRLTPPESATLVGMLKANTYYNPRLHPENARERRDLVLALMQQQGYISEKEKVEHQNAPMQLDYSNYSLEGPAQYFLYQVKQRARVILDKLEKNSGESYDLEKDGLTVYTTLDAQLQRMVRASVKEHLRIMQNRLDAQLAGAKNKYVPDIKNDKVARREIFTWKGVKVREMSKQDSLWHYKKMLNAAALIVNPIDGSVKTWLGGNHFRYLPYDLVRARRPAASAFKPILYTAALKEGYNACSYLSNEQKVYKKFDGWEPENYDHESGGEVAMWYALANSMNIPTVDLYFKTGHEAVDYTYRELGFNGSLPDKPSVALGVKEVTLEELVRAYAAFANDGDLPEFRMIVRILDKNGQVLYEAPQADKNQVLEPRRAETITAMLSRAAREGTGASLYSRFGVSSELAAKTGTSQDYKDARFMCFNRNMVFGVWVGARDPEIHFNSGSSGSGATLALPVAGMTVAKMEQSRKMRNTYLNPLNLMVDTTRMMNCQPIREVKPVENFFDGVVKGIKDLFNRDKKKNARELDKEKEEKSRKKESKVKRFFKKLFGKKKKEDDG